MKMLLIETALIYALASLLAPVTPADGRSEKLESTGAQAAKQRTGSDPGALRDDDSAQNSPQVKEEENVSLLYSWLKMAAETQSRQPDWLSPLATTSGRLKDEFRFDIWDQPSSGGNRNYQFGGGKGLELITSSRTQILMGVPSYVLQSQARQLGGFADLPLMLKVRIASAERSEGNYLFTFLLGATAPTGAHRYGAGDATLAPTLAFGKGWGRFDVQSTLGVNLPVSNTTKLGRQLQWNTVLQYEMRGKLWPEFEMNSTFYKTGKNAGEKQVFLTPGLGFGRVRLGKRFRFSSAAGMQIAATRFHTYNHRWIFSERFSF